MGYPIATIGSLFTGIGMLDEGVRLGLEYIGLEAAARDYRAPNSKSYAERGGGTKGEQLANQESNK